MKREMVHQSNGYLPVVITQEGRGRVLLGQKDKPGMTLIPSHAEMLGRVFQVLDKHFREEPDTDTIVRKLYYTDEVGNSLEVEVVVKGRANGNAGDWYITPKGWNERLLEGSMHLDEMWDALALCEGGFRHAKRSLA